jgi:hypothetical protein
VWKVYHKTLKHSIKPQWNKKKKIKAIRTKINNEILELLQKQFQYYSDFVSDFKLYKHPEDALVDMFSHVM